MYICPYVQYLLFLTDFNNCWIFSAYLDNKIKSNFMKTRPVVEEVFHAEHKLTDAQTDSNNDANCRFSLFCKHACKYLMHFVNWLKKFKNLHVPN